MSFAERSKTWIDLLAATPESRQSPVVTGLTEALLADDPERSTRAAVLLGALLAEGAMADGTRSAAQEALIYRLEQRRDLGARWKVGADVAAARALDRAHGSPDLQTSLRSALAELAHGQGPHPNLAVRVECAATVLKLSEEPAGPTTSFLLAVLRAETPAQTISPRTWPRITTLAWVKTRAAEALAAKTGTENRFRPDGPWAHQVVEAARFESLLP